MENTTQWKLPNELERNERKNTYGVKLAGFETWKMQSRHLEPCSRISEGMPPLEAHHWHTR